MKTLFILILLCSEMVLAQSSVPPANGDGSQGNPYQITSINNLLWIYTQTNNTGWGGVNNTWGKYYKQMNDIDASATSGWTGGFPPIGTSSPNHQFGGHYDGQGYKITGLYINRSSTDYIGLFGYFLGNAEIKNLIIESPSITGNNYVGALVGKNDGATITNCSVSCGTDSISGSSYVGGLIGNNQLGTITNCLVSDSTGSTAVYGSSDVGGLIGENQAGTISSSCFIGKINGSSSTAVGGLIGYETNPSQTWGNLVLQNSFFQGSIPRGIAASAGLIGYADDTCSISDCYAAASMTGSPLINTNSNITIQSTYYDVSLNNTNSPYGTPLSTSQMQQKSSFSGWDFTNTWKILSNEYPKLKAIFPPEIISVSPSDNGTITSNPSNLVIAFDENVTAQSGKYITIYDSNNNSVEQIDASSSNVSVSGSEVTVSPASTLSSGSYYILLDAGSFINAANNEFAGISSSSGWNFNLVEPDSIPGNAVSFPGTASQNNFIDVPYNASLNPSDNFTIEFWVNPSGKGSGVYNPCPLSSQSNDGTTKGFYFFYNTGGNWAAFLGGGGTVWSVILGPTVTTGKWYHLALTYSGGTMKFYVNGILSNTATNVPFVPNSNGDFYIGDLGQHLGSSPFYGKVDQVRLWKTARTQQEIRANMYLTLPGNPGDLIAYYQFNEASGTTTNDLISGFTGTFVGNVSRETSTVPLGSGTDQDTTGFTSGTANLANVSLTTSDNFDNPVDLYITELDAAPNTSNGISGTQLSNKYWKISAFGTPGTFSVKLTFTVPSSFTNNGGANPSSYTLYHRTGNDDGSWTPVVSGASILSANSITFDGISSFSQFTIGSTSPLPVELNSFTAKVNENKVVLNWQTATEINNYGFEIQRSAGSSQPSANATAESRTLNTDSWQKIGIVKGHGNSNSPKEYSFTDESVKNGKYSYRLKQIDSDGQFTYSKTIELEINKIPNEFALYQNYPNPFNPTTEIKYSLAKDGFIQLEVYNIIGQKVLTAVDEFQSAGNHSVQINGAELSSGTYFYKLKRGDFYQVKKMVLLK